MKYVYKHFIPSYKPPYDHNLRRDDSDWRGKIEIYKDRTNDIYIKIYSRITWYLYDYDRFTHVEGSVDGVRFEDEHF